MQKIFLLLLVTLLSASCVSTKSTLKNVDDNAPIPLLTVDNTFVIKEFSTDKRYGYDKDYPVNVFYYTTRNETINQERYLNALAGPKGQKISFKKLESCCPFPSKRSEMGAGFLDVYEVTWEGLKTPVILYMNIYEKGYLKVPVGFGLKK
ncbi:2-dehydro-3-deoxyphosphooctonate aldolase [Flavobacterium frigidarium]|jgi:hypothetical protein|uniref:2-dehydro-3-deoxyphosphooctonate aldolase n=1 Tax=Flavobacterium frigidarium TaxID=99286 RepID=UPI0030DC91CA|tara:strand:+ start:12482 stop:12931 length:450 start_codon:yes stop_codon:yes gene_type:complete